jgi:hypothetical protein
VTVGTTRMRWRCSPAMTPRSPAPTWPVTVVQPASYQNGEAVPKTSALSTTRRYDRCRSQYGSQADAVRGPTSAACVAAPETGTAVPRNVTASRTTGTTRGCAVLAMRDSLGSAPPWAQEFAEVRVASISTWRTH